MDVDVVESVGRQLRQQGGQLTAAIRSVDALVDAVRDHWWGVRGRDFVREWQAVHRPALLRVADSVAGLGQSALNNSAEQRGVSFPSETPGRTPSAPLQELSDEEAVRVGAAFIRSATGSDDAPQGYVEVAGAELKRLGVDSATVRDRTTGFDARVYTDGNGHYVVAFPGTDASKGVLMSEDALADAQGFLYSTKQSEQSALLAKTLCDTVGAQNVLLVGHSLGGRNAAIASVATGARAITYNAAGVNNSDIAYAMMLRGESPSYWDYVASAVGVGAVEDEKARLAESGQIVNYHATNDPLTRLQNGADEVVGSRYGLTNIVPTAIGRQEEWSSPLTGGAAHGIDAFGAEKP